MRRWKLEISQAQEVPAFRTFIYEPPCALILPLDLLAWASVPVTYISSFTKAQRAMTVNEDEKSFKTELEK